MRITDRELKEREQRNLLIRSGECPHCHGELKPTDRLKGKGYDWLHCNSCGSTYGLQQRVSQ
jgi:transcription elongation factor Elf1